MPGKPLVYTTSRTFMDYFGINTAEELPMIKEILASQPFAATPVPQPKGDGLFKDNPVDELSAPSPIRGEEPLVVRANGELIEEPGVVVDEITEVVEPEQVIYGGDEIVNEGEHFSSEEIEEEVEDDDGKDFSEEEAIEEEEGIEAEGIEEEEAIEEIEEEEIEEKEKTADQAISTSSEEEIEELPEEEFDEAPEADTNEASEPEFDEASEVEINEAPESEIDEAPEADINDSPKSDIDDSPDADIEESSQTPENTEDSESRQSNKED